MQTSFIVVQSLVFFQHRPFINAGKVSHFDPLLFSKQNLVVVNGVAKRNSFDSYMTNLVI